MIMHGGIDTTSAVGVGLWCVLDVYVWACNSQA